ncbi:MAG: hypothetical protein OHK006_22300 [Thermodesulfovibrionales bacterium]
MKHRGGARVGKGTYWNFDNGERIDVETEMVLPGGAAAVYYRMPAGGIFIAGPILGLLYAAFLPFIGIAMAAKLLMQKMAGSLSESARSSAAFGWRPSESYLAGKRKSKKEAEKKDKPSETDKS